jgi:hypothetical protein
VRSRKTITVLALLVIAILAAMFWMGRGKSSGRQVTLNYEEVLKQFELDTEHDALVVLDGAIDIRRYRHKTAGSFYVNYCLNETYPAPNSLKQISMRLESLGWKPLDEDFLNPGLPSSHVRGWTEYSEGTTNSAPLVHQWLAQWQDDSGNIAAYTLKYSSLMKGTPDPTSLTVHGIWFPATTVATMQADTKGSRAALR